MTISPTLPLLFLAGVFAIPLVLRIARALELYVIVGEREAFVYTLFGRVLGVIDQPGLRSPFAAFGLRSLLVPWFGKRYPVDTSLRQHYLRGQMVNSEEGTPMGVGVWYEMQVNDPVAYLFSNTDPEGSLEANVATSVISTLSNLETDTMLEDRHSLSRSVRATVSPLSEKWGYRLGSVYIRKVAFTDEQMVANITDKVVKRLIQVTSAIRQDGENRVGLIQSQTAFKVSQKMAEASAKRPEVVGEALQAIASRDREVSRAVLDVLETERLLKSGATVDILPEGLQVLYQVADDSAHITAAAEPPQTPRPVRP